MQNEIKFNQRAHDLRTLPSLTGLSSNILFLDHQIRLVFDLYLVVEHCITVLHIGNLTLSARLPMNLLPTHLLPHQCKRNEVGKSVNETERLVTNGGRQTRQFSGDRSPDERRHFVISS